MGTIPRQRIRVAGDPARFDGPADEQTGGTPRFWRGNDLQFEVGVFHNGVLQEVTNLASLTLEVKAAGEDGAPPGPGDTALMSKTADSFNNDLTLEQ